MLFIILKSLIKNVSIFLIENFVKPFPSSFLKDFVKDMEIIIPIKNEVLKISLTIYTSVFSLALADEYYYFI